MVSTTLCVDGYQIQAEAIWNILKSSRVTLCTTISCYFSQYISYTIENDNKKFSEEGGGDTTKRNFKNYFKKTFGLKMFLEYQEEQEYMILEWYFFFCFEKCWSRKGVTIILCYENDEDFPNYLLAKYGTKYTLIPNCENCKRI